MRKDEKKNEVENSKRNFYFNFLRFFGMMEMNNFVVLFLNKVKVMVVVMKKMGGNYEMNAKNARKEHKGAMVLDVSVNGGMGFLSPERNWGGIEIKGMNEKGLSVKLIWEGMKVFSRKDKDGRYCEEEKNMGKERGCKSYGKLEGWWWNGEVMGMEEGSKKLKDIYKEEVMKRFGNVIEILKKENEKREIVIMEDEKEKVPFSHGEVIRELISESLK